MVPSLLLIIRSILKECYRNRSRTCLLRNVWSLRCYHAWLLLRLHSRTKTQLLLQLRKSTWKGKQTQQNYCRIKPLPNHLWVSYFQILFAKWWDEPSPTLLCQPRQILQPNDQISSPSHSFRPCSYLLT